MVDSVLKEKGHPLQLTELYDELTRRGLHIGGQKPPYTLSARLSNSGRYSASREAGWWFKDTPISGSPVQWEPTESEAPDSSELSGAPKLDGVLPLSV